METWNKNKFKILVTRGQKNVVYHVQYPDPLSKGRMSTVISFSAGDLKGGWDATEEAKMAFLKEYTKAWIMFMAQKNPTTPTDYSHLANQSGYNGVLAAEKQIKKAGWTRISNKIHKKHKPKSVNESSKSELEITIAGKVYKSKDMDTLNKLKDLKDRKSGMALQAVLKSALKSRKLKPA